MRTFLSLFALLLCGSTDLAPEQTAADREGHAAAAVGTRIFVVGGVRLSGDHALSAQTDCLDTATQKWSTVAPLPTPRAFPAVVEVGGLVYVIGGALPDKPSLAITEAYDPAKDTWTKLAPMPTPRDRLAGAAFKGRVYIFGGLNEGGNTGNSAAAEVFDPAANSWTRLPDMPTPRHGLCSCALKDRILVMGGYAKDMEECTVVESFDPAANSWSTLPPMHSPRTFCGAAAVGEKVYIFNSRTDALGHPSAEVFDPVRAVWEPCEAMPEVRCRYAIAAVGKEIYAIGGVDMTGRLPKSPIQHFDVATGHWK